MDDNMRLLLIHARQEPPRWEDEEKACWDVDVLTEEFRKRLWKDGKSGSVGMREIS